MGRALERIGKTSLLGALLWLGSLGTTMTLAASSEAGHWIDLDAAQTRGVWQAVPLHLPPAQWPERSALVIAPSEIIALRVSWRNREGRELWVALPSLSLYGAEEPGEVLLAWDRVRETLQRDTIADDIVDESVMLLWRVDTSETERGTARGILEARDIE